MNKTREEAINLGKGKASKLIRKSKREKGKGKPVLLKSLERRKPKEGHPHRADQRRDGFSEEEGRA